MSLDRGMRIGNVILSQVKFGLLVVFVNKVCDFNGIVFTEKGIGEKRYFYVIEGTLLKVLIRYVIRYVNVPKKTKELMLITYLNPTYLWCFSPDPNR